MATATIFSTHTGISYIGDVADLQSVALSTSGTTIMLGNTDGSLLIITGTGFTYSGAGDPTAGTITSLEYKSADQSDTYAAYSGLSHNLVDFFAAVDATAPGSNPWDTAITFLFNGNDTGTINAVGTDDYRMIVAGAGGSDTLNGGAGRDVLIGGGGADTLNGNAGRDILRGGGGADVHNGGAEFDFADYSRSATAVVADLGTPGNNTGEAMGDTFQSVEGIIGTDFNDTLRGDAGDNILRGGLGTDVLEGGAGFDFADYLNAGGALTVDLATAANNTGEAAGDSFLLIEGIRGSDFNDTLRGDGGLNLLRGGLGADVLDGRGGFDYADYFNATAGLTVDLATPANNTGEAVGDTFLSIEGIRGGAFNDTLRGNAGDNRLVGGLGADVLAGGGGVDLVAYFDATGGITVNLQTPGSNTGEAFGDTFLSIEGIAGGDFDDVLTGNGANNTLEGGDGNDTLNGGAGNDTLLGGGDDDELRLGAGADSLNGGADLDRLTFNSNGITYGGATGVNVNLGAGTADFNTANGANPLATVMGIERVFGTAGNDFLTGGSLGRSASGSFFESFTGGAGNDTINGGGIGPSGNFRGGNDRAEYTNAATAVNVNLATGIAQDGQGGTDTLININWVRGSNFNDAITGGNANFLNVEQLEGRGGNDTLNGGAGFDRAVYQDSPGAVNVNLATGIALDGYGGTDTLISIEGARGSAFNDTLTGSNSTTVTEIFIGEGGNDTINGGGGTDYASWQTLDLAAGGVNAFLQNGSGTVNHSVVGTDTLINIEGLIGTNGNDTLAGGTGNQLFRGRGGNDTINGGAGIDTADYSSDPGGTIVNLGAAPITVGMVTVAAGTARDGWGGIFNMQGVDTLTGIENVTGSDYHDTIVGNAGNNVLNGGIGNDTMAGGLGNDTYVRNAAGDVVTELVGQGNDLVQSAVTYALGANLERLTLTGAGNINGTGNALTNILTGNTGNNVMNGGGGVDTLRGMGGNDTLVWSAQDTLFDGGTGIDTLRVTGGNLNLTTIENARFLNMEQINLTGGGNNILALNTVDVMDFSTTTNVMKVLGDAGDSINIVGVFTDQGISAGFHRYTFGAATLLVDLDITNVA